jgi:hypothetical protein
VWDKDSAAQRPNPEEIIRLRHLESWKRVAATASLPRPLGRPADAEQPRA